TIIRERYPGLPVVLTSGYSSVLAENAHSGFELIRKPYSVEALSRTLRRAIVEKRQAAGERSEQKPHTHSSFRKPRSGCPESITTGALAACRIRPIENGTNGPRARR